MRIEDETDLRRAWEQGEFRWVSEQVIARYGPGILGFLAVRLRSHSDAADVFSMFAEDLCKGLPGFRWHCPLQGWAYCIARNAGRRWAIDGKRSRARNVPIEQAGVFELVDRVRTETQAHLRTEIKSEVRRLRDELPELEQQLLILRIDRRLSWRDIAAVLADQDLGADELKREAARLRQRFRLAIDRLRRLARERGLLPPDDDDSSDDSEDR